MNNKEIALQYLAHGLSVIPLSSPSMASRKLSQEEFITKCKRSLVPWKEYQTRLPTNTEVEEWFNRWPLANIGIVTGKISNLVVFDLDSQAAIDFVNNQGGFPSSVKVKTYKGSHVYMRYPGFPVFNDQKQKWNMDIRGDGGYIVAPPSEHGSGKQYEWVEGCSIFDIEPAEQVPWTIDYLKKYSSKEVDTDNKKAPKPSKTLPVVRYS